MPRSLQPIKLLLCAVVAAACHMATANADDADLAAEVKQIFRTRCFECHGDTRREGDIHILDMSTFVGEEKQVVPGNTNDSVLYDYIATDDEDSRMPEAPRPPLTIGEFETVRKWIEADAPAFPDDVEHQTEPGQDPSLTNVIGAEYVLTKILEHVEATPRDDRQYLRFFSSNHQLTSGATRAKLKQSRQSLAKAVNHLSWQPDIVQPMVVDGDTQTVFAVDIRDLGWHETPFSVVEENSKEPTRDVDLYDQVLVEYPYGMAFEGSETFDQLWDTYLEPAGLIRPVPYVRIDWFVSTALQTPLYEDMLQLPRTLSELEKMLGVDSDHNLESFVAKRAGMTLSGVSRNNRVVERHPARYGAYWKSYDFETSKGLQNMFADPIDFHFAGGEMIWNLPNGLQAYLVTDNAGSPILEAPTAIVTDKFSEDKVVRNGLACMRCHDKGMKRFSDNIRPAFESLPSGTGLDKMEILKLYIASDDMKKLLDKDERRFLTAMEQALGEPQKKEPLIPVSRNYLDAPLTLSQASAELGLKDSTALKAVFRLPQFTRLGLAGLASGGVLRRDAWEDYFDRIVRTLGVGMPLAPVDGLTRPDHLASGLARNLKITTNKRGNVFSPGDEMFITIANDTGTDLFIELIGTDAKGRKKLLSPPVSVGNSAEFRFPEKGAITIQPQLGAEFITVYANPKKFKAGKLLRAENIADRFVHDFYAYDRTGARLDNNPSELIKKTLKIETR